MNFHIPNAIPNAIKNDVIERGEAITHYAFYVGVAERDVSGEILRGRSSPRTSAGIRRFQASGSGGQGRKIPTTGDGRYLLGARPPGGKKGG
jgi:hypothetical protein